MARLEYPVIIEPLPGNEGGGFVVLVPELYVGWRDGRGGRWRLSGMRLRPGSKKPRRSGGRSQRRPASSGGGIIQSPTKRR